MSASHERQYYRVRDIQKMLGVSRPTVWRWLADGKLRARKVVGTTLIPASAVDELIRNSPVWEPTKERAAK